MFRREITVSKRFISVPLKIAFCIRSLTVHSTYSCRSTYIALSNYMLYTYLHFLAPHLHVVKTPTSWGRHEHNDTPRTVTRNVQHALRVSALQRDRQNTAPIPISCPRPDRASKVMYRLRRASIIGTCSERRCELTELLLKSAGTIYL